MKLRFPLAVLVVSLLFLANSSIAHAQWSAIGTGYAVTTNHHGEGVVVGQPVTAVAGWAPALATPGHYGDMVTTVEFRWMFPNGTIYKSLNIAVFGPIETPDVPLSTPQEIIEWASDNQGLDVWYANNTQIPNVIGDWGVQALFFNAEGALISRNSDAIAIRAASFNVVPEVPLGTIVIALSWFGVLGVFALRRRHRPM